MANRRWSCPNSCGEPAKLAPERARTNDTRTYCLPCSERTGRLVRRVCEAAEKRRATKAETRAERAKRERAEAKERGERERLDSARAIMVGQSIKTGYYYTHHDGEVCRHNDPVNCPRAVHSPRLPHAPAYAQIAATIFSAAQWYGSMTDLARETAMQGLKLIDATAPGLFPNGARTYIEGLERVSEMHRTCPLYNWTVINTALEKDARRANRERIVSIDPGSPVSIDPGSPPGVYVTVTVTKDAPLAQLVRDDLIRRLRAAHSIIHPVADEIECAPTAFRGH